MSDKQLARLVRENEKEALECLKLGLEVVELKRPFFRRSGFWLGAIPIIIALFGAWQVSQSEVFDIAQQRLALANQELQIKELDLKNRTAAEQKRFDDLSKSLALEKERLETEAATFREKSETELSSLRQALNDQKLELEGERDVLATELQGVEDARNAIRQEQAELVRQTEELKKDIAAFEQERDGLEDQIKDLNERLELESEIAGIRGNINSLRQCLDSEDGRCGPYHPAGKRLIETLSASTSQRQKDYFDEMVEKADQEDLKIVLMAVNYRANPNPEKRQKLLAVYKNADENTDENVWYTFGQVPWQYAEADWSVGFEAWRTVLQVFHALRLDDQALKDIALGFSAGHSANAYEAIGDGEAYFYGLRRALLFAKNSDHYSGRRYRAFLMIATLHPDAFMVSAARALSENPVAPDVVAMLTEILADAEGTLFEAMVAREFPRQLGGDWEGWLQDNAELATAWSNDDLTVARQQYLGLEGPDPYINEVIR